MPRIRRWFSSTHRADGQDGDPYLESLARQLLLLRNGQTPRNPILSSNGRAVR